MNEEKLEGKGQIHRLFPFFYVTASFAALMVGSYIRKDVVGFLVSLRTPLSLDAF